MVFVREVHSDWKEWMSSLFILCHYVLNLNGNNCKRCDSKGLHNKEQKGSLKIVVVSLFVLVLLLLPLIEARVKWKSPGDTEQENVANDNLWRLCQVKRGRGERNMLHSGKVLMRRGTCPSMLGVGVVLSRDVLPTRVGSFQECSLISFPHWSKWKKKGCQSKVK